MWLVRAFRDAACASAWDKRAELHTFVFRALSEWVGSAYQTKLPWRGWAASFSAKAPYDDVGAQESDGWPQAGRHPALDPTPTVSELLIAVLSQPQPKARLVAWRALFWGAWLTKQSSEATGVLSSNDALRKHKAFWAIPIPSPIRLVEKRWT